MNHTTIITDLRGLTPLEEKPMPEKPDVSDPSNAAVKPAFKSTEFWLSTAATVIGIVLASGLLSPEDPTQAKVLQILGLVSTTLAALGYTACRTVAKNKAAEVAGFIAAAKANPPSPESPSK